MNKQAIIVINQNISVNSYYCSLFLQEELNSSECGWALLVTESDPHVLCCLLWTWLEKLRVSGITQGIYD